MESNASNIWVVAGTQIKDCLRYVSGGSLVSQPINGLKSTFEESLFNECENSFHNLASKGRDAVTDNIYFIK